MRGKRKRLVVKLLAVLSVVPHYGRELGGDVAQSPALKENMASPPPCRCYGVPAFQYCDRLRQQHGHHCLLDVW